MSYLRRYLLLLAVLAITASFMAAAPATADPPVQGLVSYWPLDEASGSVAQDAIGVNHGAVTNPNWSSDCMDGTCLDSLTRGATYAEVPDAPSLDATLGDQVSLEAWVFPYSRTYSEGQGNCAWAMFKGGDAPGPVYGFCVGGFWQAGMFEFHLDTVVGATVQSRQINVATEGRFEANHWYHFVGTYDGATMRFYINGNEEGALAQTGVIPDTASSLWFGKYCLGWVDHCYHGRVDQLALYNRVLTPVEVEQHYLNGGIVPENNPPTADGGGPYLAAVQELIQLNGAGSIDPDGDPLAYAWDYDADGHYDDAVGVTPEYSSGEPGVFAVAVQVVDPSGASDTDDATVVIYDPDGGFVTGGGWIYSDPGAYVPDPSLEGRATFGFVSKYKKNADVPTGTTEFQFHAGDLRFHSDSCEWLVVTGGDYARFKGTGTINGDGEYKFHIWAGDGDPDTFRIKIWTEDEATEAETVVYDNGFEQQLGGGSIIVHTK